MQLFADFQKVRRLGQDVQRYLNISSVATARAVKAETDSLKKRLRSDVRAAGLGSRLANTWRAKTYPEGGQASMDAAGFLYSKAPKIIQAYERGGLITSRKGRFLAIPTDNAPKRIRRQKTTPELYEQHKGKLRFVRTKSGSMFLVADDRRASYSRKTGEFRGFRKASKRALGTGKGLTTVVMFILVPQVRLRKRLEVAPRVTLAARRLGERIKREKEVLLRRL